MAVFKPAAGQILRELHSHSAMLIYHRSFGSRQGSFSQQQGGGGHSRLGERSFSYASDREPDRWAMAISPRDYLAGSLDRCVCCLDLPCLYSQMH